MADNKCQIHNFIQENPSMNDAFHAELNSVQ